MFILLTLIVFTLDVVYAQTPAVVYVVTTADVCY